SARHDEDATEELEQKIHRVAVDAARRRFSPEFINRIDKVIVFRTLSKHDLESILQIELQAVQTRILATQTERPFLLQSTPRAKAFLLAEGTDLRYGARHLKRTIERRLVSPLSSLLSTEQIFAGDTVIADVSDDGTELVFSRTSPIYRAAAGGNFIESS